MQTILKWRPALLGIAAISIAVWGAGFVAKGAVNEAVAYIEGHADNPWVTMALVAAGGNPDASYLSSATGNSAIGLAAPILAIASVGENPHAFASEDLVAKLLTYYDGTQLGDTATLNDDIFGVLALRAAGESASSAAVVGIVDFIRDHQNADGGWSFTVGGTSDTNMTATAIMALLEGGIAASDSAIQTAKAYLQSAQNADGGFPYDPVSPWGTDSDASSDAWVISAIYALGEDPHAWEENGNDPIEHLLSLQASAGYFQYQAGTGEDSFTPVTTAYGVVALSEAWYPVRPDATFEPTVDYRIEGSAAQLCRGRTAAPDALELVRRIADDCAFTYHIQETAWGPYLDQIGMDAASGMTGWLYAVDDTVPSVGAADYELEENDVVVWYFGEWGEKFTRVTIADAEIAAGESADVLVESREPSGWTALEGASVIVGANTYLTDAAGHASVAPSIGIYGVVADKNGYVRSDAEQLVVGATVEGQIPLHVTIAGSGGGGGGGGGEVTFIVGVVGASGDSMDFGTLAPGFSLAHEVRLANNGTVPLYLESSVTGDDVFRNYMSIDGASWRNYSANLAVGAEETPGITLTIPASYGGSGDKNGALTFWGVPSL